MPQQDLSTAFPLIVEGAQPDEDEMEQLLSVLHGVNRMLPPLETPRDLSVHIRRTQTKFAFKPGTLRIGYEYRFQDRYAGFENVRYAIAHEWGHAVWDANMGVLSPDWQAFSETRRMAGQLSHTLRQLQQKRHALLSDDAGPPAPPSPELKQLDMEIEALQTTRHRAKEKLHSSYLYTFNTPYNEFFADLVAVLYFEDLHAMSRSLEFTDLSTGRPRSMDPQGMRSFHAYGNPASWQPQPLTHLSKRSAYRIFAPVRSHVGRYYLNAFNLRHHKSDILGAVLRASAKELDFLKVYADDPEPLLPELAERFIRALDQELKPWRVFY